MRSVGGQDELTALDCGVKRGLEERESRFRVSVRATNSSPFKVYPHACDDASARKRLCLFDESFSVRELPAKSSNPGELRQNLGT